MARAARGTTATSSAAVTTSSTVVGSDTGSCSPKAKLCAGAPSRLRVRLAADQASRTSFEIAQAGSGILDNRGLIRQII